MSTNAEPHQSGGDANPRWRPHHLKLADALLAAIKEHADFLDTNFVVSEQGRPIMIVHRDSPNFGPTVEFLG